ncbi:glycosyltransferase family 4 protein [Mucilaginibacter terrae]|uniref:glycosyltransferase family 4 protein n=1 Tax=Mucilaginibacter terrae TaxID=1955052 RepID=UPI0036404298
MSKPRILFSVPTRHHVEIALDELEGMQKLGYPCEQFQYAAKDGVSSKTGRLRVIVQNALSLVKTARKFKPDVIYFNSRLEVLAGIRDFITIVICKTLYRQKVHFVIKSHGSAIEVLGHQTGLFNKVVLPFLKENIAGWLFLSTEEQKKVIETGYLEADKIFVTKNIVRTDQFSIDAGFRSKLGISNNQQLLLFVGRLIKEKGIYEVVKAFAEVAEQYQECTLIIVGWGSELEELKSVARSLNIAQRVIFTGFIAEAEVVSYYSNCDILVFPTYFPEGFPMALFNSVAAGMSIITTPTRAATDYLTEPDNCLWVEPQNIKSVSSALQQLLQSHQLLNSMKQKNIAKGIEFSQNRVAGELSEIIKQITRK